MRVRFFGTRGSLPVPGPGTVRYGGNTACVEVRSGDTLVVLDMGTGAYALGQELMRSGGPVRGHVLISHTHWDHIQGLPFFAPFFVPGNEWDIYAPRGLNASLRETLSGQMQYTYFPVTLEQLGATIRYHDLVEGHLTVGGVEIDARYLNHPALTLGYRLRADGVTFVYSCDHEPYAAGLGRGHGAIEAQDRAHVAFLADADLVVHDAQYTAQEYAAKVGWGHSSIEYALHVARAAGVRRLAITHHDPTRDDDALEAIVARIRPVAARPEGGPAVDLFAAREGLVLDLAAASRAPTVPAPGTATVTPALVDQSVLVAVADAARAEALAGILRADAVEVRVVAPGAVVAEAARNVPSLVVIDEGPEGAGEGRTGEGRAGGGAALARTARALRALEPELPIILVADREDGGGDERLGISDRLVEPYTENYARTRFRAWLMRTACQWARAPRPENEEARLASLARLQLLDTAPEPRFDRLTRLAARAFGAPIAALTLVDRERQWFKSSCGLDGRETPRDESFCAHVVYDPSRTLVVPDALHDPRFAGSPAVTGNPNLRFYAGHPLRLADGTCVGALCVADTRPRHFGEAEIDQLRVVAEMMMLELQAPGPGGPGGRPELPADEEAGRPPPFA